MAALLLPVQDMVSVPKLSKSDALLQMACYCRENTSQLAQENH